MRDTASDTRGKLMMKYDVANIEREYGLDMPYAFHPNEDISTHLLLENLQERGDCLFFKPKGQTNEYNMPVEDFVMVLSTNKQLKVFSKYLKDTGVISLCMD